MYEYRSEVLQELTKHGIRPKQTTRPELVSELLNDLYRFELRRLSARFVRGEIPKPEYSRHVVGLRKHYLLVSVPTRLWTK